MSIALNPSQTLGIIAPAIGAHLEQLLPHLPKFSADPAQHPISAQLRDARKACEFVGFWSMATYLAAVYELCLGVEEGGGQADGGAAAASAQAVGQALKVAQAYLQSVSTGLAVDVAALNLQFRNVVLCARPALAELPAQDAKAMFYMPIALSLEIAGAWQAEPHASAQGLAQTLTAVHQGHATWTMAASINPYVCLGALLEGAAALERHGALGELSAKLGAEALRLAQCLPFLKPADSPLPDVFLLSQVLHAIAHVKEADEGLVGLRRALGVAVASVNGRDDAVSTLDLARKLSEWLTKCKEVVQRASIAGQPKALSELATQLTKASKGLNNPTFSQLEEQLALVVQQMGEAEEVGEEVWTECACLIILMLEVLNTAVSSQAQDELADLVYRLSQGEALHCDLLVRREAAKALARVKGTLVSELEACSKSIESVLLGARGEFLEPTEAQRLGEVLGKTLSALLLQCGGVALHLGLVGGSSFAGRLAGLATDAATWEHPEARKGFFESVCRVSIFLSRLRPDSLIDLDPEDVPAEAKVSELEMTATPPASEPLVAQRFEEATPSAAIAGSPALEPEGNEAEATVAAQVAVAQEVELAAAIPMDEFIQVAGEHVGIESAAPGSEWSETAEGSRHEASSQFVDGHADMLTEPAPEANPPVYAEAAFDDAVARDAEDALENAVEHRDVDVPLMTTDVSAEAEAPLPVDEIALVLDPVADAEEAFEFVLDGMASQTPGLGPDALHEALIAAQAGIDDDVTPRDIELMRVLFEEADGCMLAIDVSLKPWRDQGGEARAGTIADIRRNVHTLKGACRTCGIMSAGAILHVLEDEMDLMPDDTTALAPYLPVLDAAIERVRVILEGARDRAFGVAAPVPLVAAPAPSEDVPVQAPASLSLPVTVAEESKAQVPVNQPLAVAGTAPKMPAPSVEQTLRVPARVANKVGEASGNLLMSSRRLQEGLNKVQLRFGEADHNVRRISPVLRELEMMAARGIASSAGPAAHGADFDPLEFDRYTQLQEICRSISEIYDDCLGSLQEVKEVLRSTTMDEAALLSHSDELQRESSGLLLLPLSTQRGRLQSVVDRAARDLGKVASLEIEAECRVPSAVIDRLMPVFEHLLRNAVAHGIGKQQADGMIRITQLGEDRERGASVGVRVTDNGSGIDYERVLNTARDRGLAKRGQDYTADQIREFLFVPGFSTAGQVTEVAGRGVGLDVVRDTLAKIGGTVSVNDAPGGGTEFVLELPTDAVSMALIPVVSAGTTVMLPLNLVQQIVPVASGVEGGIAQGASSVLVAGEHIALIRLDALVPRREGFIPQTGGRGQLVIMKGAAAPTAVLVDSVGAHSRVVVKPLGPYVRDIPGLIAGTSPDEGALCLVVNPLRLRPLGEAAEGPRAAAAAEAGTIMVIDDSATVRLVTSRLLERNGYEVITARDGLDALQKIAEGAKPAAFLMDLEMPGMGGFDLLASIRRQEEHEQTPVFVITSRSAEKHKDRARSLGASAFITKPYGDDRLLELLQSFLARATAL